MELSQKIALPKGLLVFSWCLVLTLSLAIPSQYIVESSFPMGGDPVRFVTRAIALNEAISSSPSEAFKTFAFKSSIYPGSIVLLGTSVILPLPWPDRFIWSMVLAHVSAGLSLAWLTYRVANKTSAVLAAFFWSLTVLVNGHFENGVFAHLASLTPFFLALESFSSRRYKRTVALTVLAFLLHPLSASVLAVITSVAGISGLRYENSSIDRRRLITYTLTQMGVVIGAILFLLQREILAAGFIPNFRPVVAALLQPEFRPILFLAPFGLIFVLRQWPKSQKNVLLIMFWLATAIWLTYNNVVGIGFYTHRFDGFLISLLALLAAVGFTNLLRQLVPRLGSQIWLIGTMLVFLILLTWQLNQSTYQHYEKENFARIHPGAVSAMTWLKENTPNDSTVLVGSKSRYSEWIPIVAERKLVTIQPHQEFFRLPEKNFLEIVHSKPYTHFFILKDVPNTIQAIPGNYPVIFENSGAKILRLQ